MSKVIVPIHLGNLGAIPSPSSVQPGFKLLYLRLNWLKLYNGFTELDLVLGRPLDNYTPKPGLITANDTVLSALEKLQYQISTGTGVIVQDNKLPIITPVRFDLPTGDTTPYTTLITNWLLTQTFIITETEIPYFTFTVIYDNDLANINNIKIIYLWGEGKGTFIAPPITSLRFISASASTLTELYIPVTYLELTDLIATSKLQLDITYLLTDYRTTYIQPVTGIAMGDVGQPNENPIEPLYLKAVSINTLHNVGRSALYPEDIIYYEITGDIGDGYSTEGFTKGKIYRRIDTLRNNDIGTDWRHIKYDRSIDTLLFEDYIGCYNNTIKTYYLFDSVAQGSFNLNTFEEFYNNTIGYNCNRNDILKLSGSTIGNDMRGNHFNTINDSTFGHLFQQSTGKIIEGCAFGDSLTNVNFGTSIITNKDFSSVTGLHNNFYMTTVTLKSDTSSAYKYQFSYTDDYGDTIIEDIP